jgi:hypothetical protein
MAARRSAVSEQAGEQRLDRRRMVGEPFAKSRLPDHRHLPVARSHRKATASSGGRNSRFMG